MPRRLLLERLSGTASKKLVLISAPPGFGKTHLMAEWIAENDHLCYCWLSLDEGDNDPVVFLNYLITGLQQIEPTVGTSVQPLLVSSQPLMVDQVIAGLANDVMEVKKTCFLILDDYHLLHNEVIHRAVGYLLNHQPPNLHLVLLTREDPPLPLPRLRARGEITEIREADLRFTLEEATAFVNLSMSLDLSPGEIAGLEERTEGWVAGLQMAALALQTTASHRQPNSTADFIAAFRGDDRYIIDYLMEEVFCRQSPEIQDFLLRTSILDRLCAPLCDVIIENREPRSENGDDSRFSVLGSLSSQTILDYLDRSNLFLIPLDNRREWYRYHQLFVDLLRYRLQQEFPERVADLHRRASDWFAQAGDVDEAMKHAFAAEDFTRAAILAEENLLKMIGGSRIATYLAWIRCIPPAEIGRRAHLCVGCGWASVLTGQTEAAEGYIVTGEAALERFEPLYSRPERRWITREEVRAHLTAVRAYIEWTRGNFNQAVIYSRQALEELPGAVYTVRCIVALTLGLIYQARDELDRAQAAFTEALAMAQKSEENLYVALTALSLLGGIADRQGPLGQAVEYYQRAIRLGTTESGTTIPLPAVGYAHGGLVAVHYQRGELDEAQSHLSQAFKMIEQISSQDTFAMAYIYQALLEIERGELLQAEQSLSRVAPLPLSGQGGQFIWAEWVTAHARLLAARGDSAGVIRWLEVEYRRTGQATAPLQMRTFPDDCPLASLPHFLLLAEALLAQASFEAAGVLLDQVIAAAGSSQNRTVLLEALVFQAVWAQRWKGSQMDGVACLQRALELGAPEGYVQPYFEAGEPLSGLLRQAIARGIQPAYAGRLLAGLAGRENRRIHIRRASGGVGPAVGQVSQVEPLTGREQQVLRLLAAGLSSNEIARELVISVSTARSYLKTLYQKLDAHSRDEAVEKGCQLGLL